MFRAERSQRRVPGRVRPRRLHAALCLFVTLQFGCKQHLTIEVRDEQNRPVAGAQISQRERVGVLALTTGDGRAQIQIEPRDGQARIEVERPFSAQGRALAFENPYLLEREDFRRRYRFIRAFGGEAPAPPTATLLVGSTPPGATVRIDGVVKGTTPIRLDNLPVGGVRIDLTKGGYALMRGNVLLHEGQQSFTRILAAEGPFSRTYLVQTRPGFAQVFVDGSLVPRSPPFHVALGEGQHHFHVVNQAQTIDVTLTYNVQRNDVSHRLILDYPNHTTQARP